MTNAKQSTSLPFLSRSSAGSPTRFAGALPALGLALTTALFSACGGTVNVAAETVADGGAPSTAPVPQEAAEWQTQDKVSLYAYERGDRLGAGVSASERYIFAGGQGRDARGRAISVIHVFERRGVRRFVRIDRLDFAADEAVTGFAAASDGVLVQVTKHDRDGKELSSRVDFAERTGNRFTVTGALPFESTATGPACALATRGNHALLADLTGSVRLFDRAAGAWSLAWSGNVEAVVGPNNVARCPMIAVSGATFALASRSEQAPMSIRLFDRGAAQITERAPLVIPAAEVGRSSGAAMAMTATDLILSFDAPSSESAAAVRVASRASGYVLGPGVLSPAEQLCGEGCRLAADDARFAITVPLRAMATPRALVFGPTGDGGWNEVLRVPRDPQESPSDVSRPALAGPVLVFGVPSGSGAYPGGFLVPYVEEEGRWSAVESGHLTGTDSGLGFSVGASANDSVVAGRQSAHVYERTKDGPRRVAALTPKREDDAVVRVVMGPDTVFMTAARGDGTNGALDVFSRSASGVWSEAVPLATRDVPPGHRLGATMSFDGATLAVGADWLYPYPGTTETLAFLFERRSGAWTQTQILRTPDREARYADQTSVLSVSGGQLLFAGKWDRTMSVYAKDAAGSFSKRDTLAVAPPEGTEVAYFEAGAIDGERAIVAARETGPTEAISTATLFERNASGAFVQVARLTPADLDAGSRSAPITAVAISGGWVAIGVASLDMAPGYAADQPVDGVYLFKRTEAGLVRMRVLRPTDAKGAPGFGAALALTPSLLVVGSPSDAAAYLIAR